MGLKDIPDRASKAYRQRELLLNAFEQHDKAAFELALTLFGQQNYLHGLENGHRQAIDYIEDRAPHTLDVAVSEARQNFQIKK